MDIITVRLTLRAAKASDIEGLHRVYSNPEVMRYWSHAPFNKLSETKERLDGFMRQPPPVKYRVIDKDGEAIGNIGIHEGTEIGFILGKEHWRRGIMREALMAYLPWAFENLDIPEITADADPENLASCAILKAIGFRETGRAQNTFCVQGKWTDSVYFAIKAADFA